MVGLKLMSNRQIGISILKHVSHLASSVSRLLHASRITHHASRLFHVSRFTFHVSRITFAFALLALSLSLSTRAQPTDDKQATFFMGRVRYSANDGNDCGGEIGRASCRERGEISGGGL